MGSFLVLEHSNQFTGIISPYRLLFFFNKIRLKSNNRYGDTFGIE